jgi:hypothetical protein
VGELNEVKKGCCRAARRVFLRVKPVIDDDGITSVSEEEEEVNRRRRRRRRRIGNKEFL